MSTEVLPYISPPTEPSADDVFMINFEGDPVVSVYRPSQYDSFQAVLLNGGGSGYMIGNWNQADLGFLRSWYDVMAEDVMTSIQLLNRQLKDMLELNRLIPAEQRASSLPTGALETMALLERLMSG